MATLLGLGLFVALTFLLVCYFPGYSISGSFAWTFPALFTTYLSLRAVYHVILYPIFFTPYKHLPVPPGRSIWNGHFKILQASSQGTPSAKWTREVPNDGIIRYYFMLNRERLLVTSTKALADVLVNRAYDFTKTRALVASIGWVTGTGVILAEGDVHRVQRKNLNPAFSFRHIKELYPIFWQKSVEMAERIAEDIGPLPVNAKVISFADYTGRATLEIIGLAGMGYDLESVNELREEYRKMFTTPGPFTRIIRNVVFLTWPELFFYLPLPYVRTITAASQKIREISRLLVQRKRYELSSKKIDDSRGDIISVALESGNFTEEGLVDQIMTFLAAGHETTSIALQYGTRILCTHPEVQSRLREEVRAKIPSPGQSKGANGLPHISSTLLDTLPYLNAFCNELFRFYPPVTVTTRQAIRDTVIAGQPIKKGTNIAIAPRATNRNPEFWGEDADVFNPDRWLAPGCANTGAAESNYAFLTFIHGPRSCIGNTFAKGELMCLVAVLAGRFEMELEDPDKELEITPGITNRPADGVRARLKVLEGW
ncbi:cytochrome P450 monooxygenase [Trichophyton equinum CBS 127.97]|uniref:Cytochrome P450 monooxygenase n=1 Tax=Trichophyton equinum (strain ATCC MYA-4606 / CBS 127.97) TaxID=559882 RepID=F2PPC3_TRIEC|nr:cytochrome P450 monooxygenase [Trichophyton equinum CBS 127.97]